jgi:membrane protein DedA with SNARE-associated domain
MSLPAGMVRMPFWKFIGLTLAGSCLWHIILISLGYFIGDNSALIKNYITAISLLYNSCWWALFLTTNTEIPKKIAEAI